MIRNFLSMQLLILCTYMIKLERLENFQLELKLLPISFNTPLADVSKEN